MCFIRLLNLEYNFLFAVDTRIYEQFFRICERRVCPVKSALSSYTWRSIEGGCGASALHMSRMSQHASVIAQNDTSVPNGVTAGCGLDAGRQDEPRERGR